MSNTQTQVAARSSPKFSLDTWAVILALALAALIRFGIIPRVPW